MKIATKIFSHLAFWVLAILAFGFIFRITEVIDRLDVIYSMLFHISIMLGVYINFYWIDKLLNKRFYLPYILMFALTLSGMVLVNIYTFDRFVDLICPDLYMVNQFRYLELIIISIIYLLISSAIKLSQQWFNLQKAKHETTKLEKVRIDTELQKLKSQINPHFLFNSLNVIYSKSLSKDQDTSGVILKLSDILRYVIYDSRKESVTLASEVLLLRKYIDLQKYRIEDNVRITFTNDADYEAQVAPLIFLTLLENAFKHGGKSDLEDPFIEIDLRSDAKKIYFTIINNKISTEIASENRVGIGLQNIKKRLALEYPQKHRFEIEVTDKTFKIYLEIEYES